MQPLHYTVRRSPYFSRTVELGAIEFMVYNHTYMPLDYGRDQVRMFCLNGVEASWLDDADKATLRAAFTTELDRLDLTSG